MTPDLPPISIVVIGRNEGERLVQCLESIRAADYPQDKIDLIYVDSRSTDDSCAQATAKGATVICIGTGPCTAARARNVGWRHARHEIVHFFDGDTIVHPQWLREAVAGVQDPTIGCVFGRLEEIRPHASIYMRASAFDWYIPPGSCRFCGGVACFRRDTLGHLGGFREDLIAGEEPELCYRLRRSGLRIWRLDEPMALHDLGMTHFTQYWRRTVRSGWGYCVVAALCYRGKERLWLRENLTNLTEVALWCCLLLWSVAACHPRGLYLLAALVAFRVAYIAARTRKRSNDLRALLFYGLHCQFRRIPFFVGQIKGVWFLFSGLSAKPIDYSVTSHR